MRWEVPFRGNRQEQRVEVGINATGKEHGDSLGPIVVSVRTGDAYVQFYLTLDEANSIAMRLRMMPSVVRAAA